MIPAAFDYSAPASIDEAVSLLRDQPGEAKVMSGGQSLLPMMKLRLAMPGLIVDLRRVRGELSYVRRDGDTLRIGAMTTHADVAASQLLRQDLPVLAETAAEIADVQVRNVGTIGGSLAHADPVADYPATLLALDAQASIIGPGGARTTSVADLLIDAFFTTLAEDEIITEVSIPVAQGSTGATYLKFANKASHFAIVGVAAVVGLDAQGRLSRIAVGITGAASRASRAQTVEDALRGQSPTPDAIAEAATHAADGLECLTDLHGSADYRANLCRVLTRRAITQAVEQIGG